MAYAGRDPHQPDPENLNGLGPLAVLVSGGLDSGILLWQLLHESRRPMIHPVYVRTGMAWETTELDYLRRYLEVLASPRLAALRLLDEPVADLYGEHWSVTGRDVPGANTPDDAVFLPGRNMLLLTKSLLWCHLKQLPALALATLKANPFPDATPAFFDAFQKVVNQSLDGNVQIVRPYASLNKIEVLRLGSAAPLRLTCSCIRPVMGRHCGRCNKCAERRTAFHNAGLPDPTDYDVEDACIK